MQLRVDYAPALTIVPQGTFVGITTSSSTCVVNDEVGTASLSGELGPLFGLVGMNCAGGTATGRGTFRSSATGFPVTNVTIEAVGVGGHMVVDLAYNGITFRGVGNFEQDPAATAACVAGTPVPSTTWTGTLVFEDPILPG
jgi:hypothetical protein